jgi:disulfide bond formation protein DsbB
MLAVGGLALLAVTVALYVDYFVYNGRYFKERVKEAQWPLVIATTIGSLVMTLVYSEYFKFVPCSMCWLQRIALYPQALMALMAWKGSDVSRFPLYGIALSMFGLIVGVYQYIYQMLPAEAREGLAPCLIDGSNADCAVKVMNEFGFVTFPLLSAISFAFLIVIYLYMRRS